MALSILGNPTNGNVLYIFIPLVQTDNPSQNIWDKLSFSCDKEHYGKS